MSKTFRKNPLAAGILFCLFLLLPLMLVPAQAKAANCTQVWQRYFATSSNYGEIADHEFYPPYWTLYFTSDGMIYDSNGTYSTFTTGTSSYSVPHLGTLSVDSASGGSLYQSSYGSSMTNFFSISSTFNNSLSTGFKSTVSATADAFVTGEEITVKMGATGGKGPYTHTLHVFREDDASMNTYGYVSDMKSSLDEGRPDTLIFKEPGTYHLFVNSVDANNDRSIFAEKVLTISQGPTTTAEITNCSIHHDRVAEGDFFDYQLTADPGAGDLKQIVYLYKDNVYLSRHELNSLDSGLTINEDGDYKVRIRLKDMSNNAYSPFYSFSFTIHPLYDYTVLTAEDNTQSIRLDYFNSYQIKDVVLPATFDGYPVTEVDDHIFSYFRDSITSLTWTPAVPEVYLGNTMNAMETLVLPEGVTAIRDGYYSSASGAFSDCDKLTSVSLPSTLTSIGSYAFYNCDGLTAIEVPDNVISIGNHAFNHCDLLSDVTLGKGLKSIGDYAFSYCDSLAEIPFPSGLESIGDSAFSSCPLVSLSLPDSVTEIGSSAFYGCKNNLTSLRWTAGIPEVPGGMFDGYTVLETVVLPEGVTAIGNAINSYYGAFYNCDKLTSVSLPSTLTAIGTYAFDSCSILASIEIPDNVASIGDDAFRYCVLLSDVTLGKGLKSIGEYAFSFCDSLAEIPFPNGLETIGSHAFYNCPLTSLSLPDSVTEIGSYAFQGCENTLTSLRWTAGIPEVPGGMFDGYTVLETVVLPEGVTAIGNAINSYYGAFYNCDKLTSVSLPSTLTAIGTHAFHDCSILTSIEIPDNVASIGDDAFKSCVLLSDVTLGKGLQSIGEYAFSFCDSLAEIAFPSGLESIGDSAFYSCPLTSLSLPDSVTKIGSSAFQGCENTLTSLRWTAGIPEVPGSMFNDHTVLETVVLPEGVTAIGNHADSYYGAFYNCDKLTSVSLPSTLTSIGSYAFSNCGSLTAIEIPDNVASIGDDAFKSCVLLSDVTLGKGLQSIGEYAFSFCDSLAGIAFPSGLESIGGSAFWYCPLTSLSLPDSVTEIGSSAFQGCENTLTSLRWTAGIPEVPGSMFDNHTVLETVVLPEGVTAIGNHAFDGCSILTSIEIPDNVASIDAYAFDSCDLLSDVTLGKGLKSIGEYAFNSCDSLAEIAFPSGLESIGGSAFSSCPLTSLSLPDTVTEIGSSAFWGCEDTLTSLRWTAGIPEVPGGMFDGHTVLETVVLPEGVTAIGNPSGSYNGAFYNCDKLTSVSLPSTLTAIGTDAFSNCGSLTAIEIPDNVASIGDDAFKSCDLLSDVTLGKGLKSIGEYAFNSCTSLAEIAFPSGLESIGDSAFSSCPLTSLSLPDSVTEIGSYAFNGCENTLTSLRWTAGIPEVPGSMFNDHTVLETVVLPESVTAIGNHAFDGCSILTSIEIPDNVASIGAYAFYSCDLLSDVTLGKGLKSIGAYAFSYCDSLAEIAFPSGLESIGDSAFSFCPLTSLSLPDSVTEIGSSAFWGCQKTLTYLRWTAGIPLVPRGMFDDYSVLETVVLPEGVTGFEPTNGSSDGAFMHCPKLTSVSLPSTMNDIGTYTFYGCDALTTITIPKLVTVIGVSVFNGCDQLSQVTLPAALETISNYAFDDCTSLTSITLPDGLESIGNSAFYNCPLTSLSLPDSVTEIGSSAFQGCEDTLTSLRWTAGVPVVPKGMFSHYSVLETVVLPEGVTGLEDKGNSYGVFAGCDQLVSVTLPSTLTFIGTNAFNSCDNLAEIRIPDQVTSIGNYAFQNCKLLSDVALGKNLKTIGSHAFYNCTSLSEITFPNGLESIGSQAFYNCPFTSLSLPDSVTALPEGAFTCHATLKSLRWTAGIPVVPRDMFDGYSVLETVVLPEGVTGLEDNGGSYGSFHNCDSLVSISMPSTLTSIGSQAFRDCDSLKQVIIGKNVTSIGDNAFYQCDKLAGVTFNSKLTSIGYQAFYDCPLTALSLPDSLTSLGNYAFNCKTTLKSLRWTAGIPVVPAGLFNNYSVLENVVLPEGVTGLEYKDGSYGVFENCDQLVSVKMPSTLTSIGSRAFYDCGAVCTIYLPCGISEAGKHALPNTFHLICAENAPTTALLTANGLTVHEPSSILALPALLTEIEAQAFQKGAAMMVIVPEGCESIGAKAFANMSNLYYVQLPSTITSMAADAFTGNNLLGVIAPAGSVAYDLAEAAGLPVVAAQ